MAGLEEEDWILAVVIGVEEAPEATGEVASAEGVKDEVVLVGCSLFYTSSDL